MALRLCLRLDALRVPFVLVLVTGDDVEESAVNEGGSIGVGAWAMSPVKPGSLPMAAAVALVFDHSSVGSTV